MVNKCIAEIFNCEMYGFPVEAIGMNGGYDFAAQREIFLENFVFSRRPVLFG